MSLKLTARGYRALRQRLDHATLARDGRKGNLARVANPPGESLPSEANVGRLGRGNKFGANAVEIDGFRFASGAEGRRYLQLKAAQAAGIIRGLELQPRLPFEIDDERMFTYVADFAYEVVESGEKVIEDVKGVLTPVYKLKKRIIEKYYGIKITETRCRKK
jgi:hypothetical protein